MKSGVFLRRCFRRVFQSPLNDKACRAKCRMLDRIVSKTFLFLLFSNACRSDSKSPISPITVAGAVIRAFEIISFSLLHFSSEKIHFSLKAGSGLDEISIPL